VGIRFCATAILVAAYMRAMRIRLSVPKNMIVGMAALSLFFYLQQGLIFKAITLTRAGRVGVILNTQPIITAIVAHWFVAHDRLTPAKIAGLLMAVCGVVFVFRESFGEFNSAILVGDLLTFVAAVLWGTQTVVAKHVVKHVSPDAMICWQAGVASALFFATSALVDPRPIVKQPLDAAFFGAMGYIVLVGTVFGFVAWTYLIRHNNPSQVTSFCFVTPIASVFFARWVLGEPLTSGITVAAFLVGAGIFVANSGLTRRRGARRAADIAPAG
jgi:O-acetylserine/cysteine efflux transporter